MRLNKLSKILTGALLIILTYSTPGTTLEVEYIGSISDGLFSPTSIEVSEDQLAVLEPFSNRITTYSIDGVLRQKVDIEGEIMGLSRFSDYKYLFCDRSGGKIMAVDISSGYTYPFITLGENNTPTDVIACDNRICVLEAGSGRILITDLAGNINDHLTLIKPGGDRIGFASSFALNENLGIFYVFDQLSSEIWMIGIDGRFIGDFCSFGSSTGEITRGGEIACDPDGNVFISDRFQGLVAIFSPDGEFIASINLGDFDRSPLSLPSGLAVDDQGFMYVSTTEGRRIEIIYVDVDGAPGRAMTALQAYPADNDTINIENVKLVSYVAGDSYDQAISGFDFQLFEGDELDQPIAEVVNLAPSESPDDTLEATVIAEWTVETSLEENVAYSWRARARDSETTGEWTQMRRFYVNSLPRSFSLDQNYPNPFNPSTFIAFEIPEETDATITIFNSLGQIVKTMTENRLPAGRHEIVWDGRDEDGNGMASGIYFYRLTAGDFSKTRKMVIIK
jgi:hypothetical protein